ncbi:hypothetical protein [Micromonospora schwarzwaldensis]|uniref:hypothetical protein n=1 Tax=Micromonospora sp. DSM 45708 TaxID=3111767 RepID=UPI0031CF4496
MSSFALPALVRIGKIAGTGVPRPPCATPAAGDAGGRLVTVLDEPTRKPPPRRGLRLLLPLALLVPLALVTVEGINRAPHPEMPRPPAALRAAKESTLALPAGGVGNNVYLLSDHRRVPNPTSIVRRVTEDHLSTPPSERDLGGVFVSRAPYTGRGWPPRSSGC